MTINKNRDLIISVEDPISALHYLWGEQKRREKVYWKMKDGNLIDIENMTDEHLDNTVEMLGKMVDDRAFNEAMAEEATGGEEQ